MSDSDKIFSLKLNTSTHAVTDTTHPYIDQLTVTITELINQEKKETSLLPNKQSIQNINLNKKKKESNLQHFH